MTHYYASCKDTLAQGTTNQVFIKNDSDSPFYLWVNDMITSSEVDTSFAMYKNVTQDSSGTSIEVTRAYRNPSGYILAEKGGSYSSKGVAFIDAYVPAGTKNDSGSSLQIPGERYITILEPGENLLGELTNESNNDGNCSFLALMQEYNEV